MANRHARTQRFTLRLLLAAGMAVLSQAHAIEIRDPLTDPSHPEWVVDRPDKTGGEVSVGANGALLKVEPRNHALLKRSNKIVGSDAEPLDASVYIISEGGFALHPGLHVYWDNNNYVSVLYTVDNHVYVRWSKDGVDGARDFYNCAPDSKKHGFYVRVIVVSRNVFTLFSMDGENWQRLCDIGGRPGKPGVAPTKFLLGRAWAGEKNNKDAHLDLCNDYYPNGEKNLIGSTFRNFYLRDAPVALPEDELKIDAAESWEQTEEKLEPNGAPKTWTLLGPRPDIDFALWKTKDALEPEKTDDWSQALKDERGHNLRVTHWTRPEDNKELYVDLGEIIEPSSAVLAYAQAELDWPVEGPANLFFDDNGRAAVFLNNKQVFTDVGRDPRQAAKDRFCIPVHMKQGKNIIKVKAGQMRGDWGFFLRLDRTDTGFRIRSLEKLLELHPQDAAGWRGAHAMFEIARRFQQIDNFPAALDMWQKAIDKFDADEELRVEAFAGKARLLAQLRDFDALAASSAEYLARHGRGYGARIAMDACISGEALSGKLDAAEERIKKWVDENGATGEQTDWALRLLAGAQAEAGHSDRQLATLEKLAAHSELNPLEQACAYFEAGFTRQRIEADRAGRSEKRDLANMTAACQDFQKGFAGLSGAANPQAQAWAQEAADDLKAGKHDRALAGYWGAALLALCANDPQTAPYLSMSKAYSLPPIALDPKTNKPRELNDPLKKESWKVFSDVVATVKSQGNWKAIGPFDYDDKNPPGPEKNPDFSAKHPGRGGEKAWVEVDPNKTWNDAGGSNLQTVLGNCRGGVAYVAIDYDAAQPQQPQLTFSARGAWTAWLDGRVIGSKSDDFLSMDMNRTRIEFPAGRHRLLIRLTAPSDDNFLFRGGLSTEPELACNILRFAWLQREYPDPTAANVMMGDAWWLLNFAQNKVPPPVVRTFGESLGMVVPLQDWRWNCTSFGYSCLKRAGMHAEAAAGYRWLLRRLVTSASYSEQVNQIWAATSEAFDSLLNTGETAAADELFRDFIAMFPDHYAATGYALVFRGVLREDFSQTQGSRAFFERAIREYPQAADNFRFAAPGLAFSKEYFPDRLIYATSEEAQSAVDVATRLMHTGDPADIEKAMAKFGELIRNGAESLIRISDSRYFPRHVGIREFVRAFIAALNEDARDAYVKSVAASSDAALHAAAARNDATALEAIAAEYHYTPAAAQALNLAGNLYLDRGEALQAASAFRALLAQTSASSGISAPMVAAKNVRALLSSGNPNAARAALSSLNGEFAAQSFTFGGQAVTGAQFAAQITRQIDRVSAARQNKVETETHLSNIQRRGPPAGSPAPKPGEIQWARTLLPSVSMDVAGWRFVPDPFVHLQQLPALSLDRAFISGMESVQSLDLATGRVAWQQSWDSVGASVRGRFTGFPLNSPTLYEGKLYARALNGRRSALQCFDATSGKIEWTTGDLPEFMHSVWISDPLLAYGLCIACYADPADLDTHGVAALDAATGRLRWKHALATGATGITVQAEAFGSTMQLGPPAADERIVYAATGLGSLAAINAFSGEVIWLSGYPRVDIKTWDGGNVGEWRSSIRTRVLKLLSRGAVSPIVTADIVVLAPKDACGLIGFDRRTGEIRWHDDMLDDPYLAGVCGNTVLLAGNTVRAIQVDTGATAWEYEPPGETIFGQPGYSGETLYLPTEERLRLVDAHNGKLLGAYPWDRRVGPLGNLTVTATSIIGVNPHFVAAIGAAGNAGVELPALQAQSDLREGKLESAATELAKAEQSDDADAALNALTGRTRLLQQLNKKEDGLADIDRALTGKPQRLESATRKWEVDRDVLAESLRAQLGQPPAAPALPPAGISGTLAFAWLLDGEDPQCVFPEDGPQDRFLAYTGAYVCMQRLSPRSDTLWRSYAGPGMTSLQTGPNAVCVSNSQQVAVFDRNTGEPLWRTGIAQDSKRRARARAGSIQYATIGADAVAVAGGDGLFVYDVRSGREIWANERYGRAVVFMNFRGDTLVVVQTSGDDTPAVFTVYDSHTGHVLSNIPFRSASRDKWRGADRYIVSPDRKQLVVSPYGVNRLMAFDLTTGQAQWDIDSLYLHGDNVWNQLSLEFHGSRIFYHGFSDSHWYSFDYDGATGKQLARNEHGRLYVEDGSLVFGDKTIVREGTDEKGAPKEFWKTTLTGPFAENNDVRKAFVSNGRLYLLMLHGAPWTAPDQFMLRTMDWNSGQLLGDQRLPGMPMRNSDNRVLRTPIEQRGNLLLYTAREGVFAYSPVAESKADSIAKLKNSLADKSLAAAPHRDLRRALNELDTPVFQISPAPPGTHLDDETGDPALIESAENYVPAGDDSAWKGPQDLSARIYAAWSGAGLELAVVVRDDRFVPALPGRPLQSGDSIRVALNGLTDPTIINRAENVVITMAQVEGRTVINTERAGGDEELSAVTGRVTVSPDANALRYELSIPWALLRRDPGYRPGTRKDLLLGLAVFDNDGDGVKGAMEFGAGVAGPVLIPHWMTRVTLSDLSKEKIERYRKVMAAAPDAPETLGFLRQIAGSKRGAKPEQERAAELEDFIKAHPDCSNTIPALKLLRGAYAAMGAANNWDKALEFARSAKCPARVIDSVLKKSIRVWVLPDEKNPPQQIMLQVNIRNYSWCRRAYWGANRPESAWGDDGTPQHLRMGPIPTPGQWTLLEMNAVDFEMSEHEIQGFGFTSFGGLTHFEQATAQNLDKEIVLLSDGLPKDVRLDGSGFNPVPAPHHTLPRSWTGGATGGLLNTALNFPDVAPWFSFKTPEPAKPAPAGKPDPKTPPPPPDHSKEQALAREMAGLVADTPEAWGFLRREIDLYSRETQLDSAISDSEDFLAAHPETVNANTMLQSLAQWYAQKGERNPEMRCDSLVRRCKLPRDTCRVFYAQIAPTWMDWRVIGPFPGAGDRRGLDQFLPPEKSVDLAWRTKGIGDTDIGWTAFSAAKDDKGKPNAGGFVELYAPFAAKLDSENRAKFEKTPYFGYAYAHFTVPSKRKALLLYGVNDLISIWINNRRVVGESAPGNQKDKETAEITLNAGANEILVKAGVAQGHLGFFVRIADENGRPIDDLTVQK